MFLRNDYSGSCALSDLGGSGGARRRVAGNVSAAGMSFVTTSGDGFIYSGGRKCLLVGV